MGVPTTEMATNGAKHANGTPSSLAAKYNLADHFIGLNHVGAAAPSKVKDFVMAHGGHTVITNVSSRSKSAVEAQLTAGTGPDCQQRYRSG
jgi:acetyl-CoA carboxylase/biotin carboxylase 1